ncbi:MAG: Morphology and auto-aggregation control protein [Bacteroidota bacterium]|jgi:LysR family hydrogen peroxide-inducible transcriptional activator
MTITQMEYTVAVGKHGSFITAAEKCNVTQPTLSMQIQKLEEELGVKIFDRNHHPIAVTDVGAQLIEQMKSALQETHKVFEIINDKKKENIGKLSVGILPSIAPTVLPKILRTFIKDFPDFELQLFEMHTEALIKRLKEDKLDIAIMSTPLGDKDLKETPLYFEPYVAYFSPGHPLLARRSVAANEISKSDLWTLNDEHCVAFQAVQLCNDDGESNNGPTASLKIQSGSVASVIKLVESNGGATILPELFLEDFLEDQLENVRFFDEPTPVREVSMVTSKYFVKNKLAQAFINHTLDHVPDKMKAKGKKAKVLKPVA